MKISLHRQRAALQLAPRATGATHPDTAHNLLAGQRRMRFAQAQVTQPARIADDALTEIAFKERRAVRHLLPAPGISHVHSLPHRLRSRLRFAARTAPTPGTAR